MLRSDLCGFSDAYIVVKGKITVSATDGAKNIRDKKTRPLAFKNNAPFISCFSKINGVLVENAEDLDIVMLMYNLIEYGKNYSETPGSLWNYYRDQLSDKANDDNGPNKVSLTGSTTSITGSTYNVAATAGDYDANKKNTKKAEIAVPLKHLSNL